jgi:uncharacterized coiled-coil DUF342 family protein
VHPQGTLLTPKEKQEQAIDWSSGGKPVVIEHAGMTQVGQITPGDAVVGRIIGGMVDRRQNLLAVLELRLERSGIAEIEEALRVGRPVGVSLMTRRYLGSVRKEVEHLGVTFTPAFGRDGSWTLDWSTDAAAFRERLRVYYGQEPGLFLPEELRARLRQFETRDSEYLKRIRAYRERLTDGNVDSWKSKLPPTIVVMATSDAMELDTPLTGTAAPAGTTATTPESSPLQSLVATPSQLAAGGRRFTPSSIEDHLARIRSQPMVEDQLRLADEVLMDAEKEHRENPYRFSDPEGRKASELLEKIELLRQEKAGVSNKMLTAAIGRGFLTSDAQHVIDRLRDPATAADVRTQPFARQLTTLVAASGQILDETLSKLEKTKTELESERVKNQRTHEEALAQKQLAEQKGKELQDLYRRLAATEKEMSELAAQQKQRDAKLDALAAASTSPVAATPVREAALGVTASDAASVRREKTGTPARNQGSVMASSLEEAIKRTKNLPEPQSRSTDTLSSISFAVTPNPAPWQLGGVRVSDVMFPSIRVNQ